MPSRGHLDNVLSGRRKVSYTLNLGTWNVRTLMDQTIDKITRPPRRTALVASELKRYNIDIAARLPDEDSRK